MLGLQAAKFEWGLLPEIMAKLKTMKPQQLDKVKQTLEEEELLDEELLEEELLEEELLEEELLEDELVELIFTLKII